MVVMMFFAHNGYAYITFVFRHCIRENAAKHGRHKSCNRSQNRERSAQQRISCQDRIHSRRRRRNQKAHASALAGAFAPERNGSRNHAAATNRERYAEQGCPQHRLKIRLCNLWHIQVIRNPDVNNARQQKTEQQERRHFRKQRYELPEKLFKNLRKLNHVTCPSYAECGSNPY